MTDPAMRAATVPCPGCGRAYDAARFAGGRSAWCACGTRVGLRLPRPLATTEPRFFADAMLDRLARWLRALGYDTACEPAIPDAELVRRAVREHRVVLTRDRRLAEEWWIDGLLLLREEHPLAQLREVAATLPLSLQRAFTRCTRCGDPLRPADADAALRAPDSVRDAGEPLHQCPACGRLYWRGGHTERMRRALRSALGDAST